MKPLFARRFRCGQVFALAASVGVSAGLVYVPLIFERHEPVFADGSLDAVRFCVLLAFPCLGFHVALRAATVVSS